jgi:Ca2+-binding RTX toxin-like protein
MSFPIADYTGMLFWLHPVQMSSTDEVVQLASFDPGTGTFAVPARTTAVFVQMQDVPACTVLGTAGSDRLSGTKNADVICGLDGDDRINAQGGDDVIYAGAGDDDIVAGPGDDSVDGGPGFDTCNAGPGQNTVDNCERGPKGPKKSHPAKPPKSGRS